MAYQSDIEAQQDEVDALAAIYGEDFELIVPPGTDPSAASELRIWVEREAGLQLVVYCPADYPSQAAPIFQLNAPRGVQDAVGTLLSEALEEGQQQQKGEVKVYAWVELLRERLQDLDLAPRPDEVMARAAAAEAREEDLHAETATGRVQDLPQEKPRDIIPVTSGSPFTDRKSTFQAHLAEVHSELQVQQVMRQLLSNNKIARATHNIMAYRIYDAERGVQLHDNSDDGENAAGARLAQLLHVMQVNNVIVVVSRWFGGIHLGPDRFKHINNAARDVLQECGYGQAKDAAGGAAGARRHKSSKA